MNVLVDRHHAGLYRSLQLLGGRLGWDLYTPIGTDWMEEGYWNFGGYEPKRSDLARQYLVPSDGVWEPIGVRYRTYDPEFPDVPIDGIPLDVARLMKWDYIVATVDDNQFGFKRFADERGAQYVVQVGNTNQYVDWRLDPLALVTSEVPILGRGVLYRQEMDPAATTFRRTTFANRLVRQSISSFVNCFPLIKECYPLYGEAQALLPEFTFRTYGIDGPQGVVKPIARLASVMSRAGFGWHDKVHGDGFGHVIHGWAAVGRPLIGHASHYAGKMGSVFWRDGETCIDLDQHTLPEAMQLVRDIAADPDRHAAMCHAIRAVFDEVYDPEQDARNIAELLGIPQAVAA